LVIIQLLSGYKRHPTLQAGDGKNISSLHLANSRFTPFVTLFFFSNTKMLDEVLLPRSRGLN
jgi:hypothetical protein